MPDTRRDTRMVFIVCLLTLFCRTASGEEVIRTVDWQQLASTSTLVSGTVVAATDSASGAILQLVHTESDPATFHLVTIDHPGIRTARYALKGRVRHNSVADGSYLEMWSHLPDGAFFSRALEQSGPMGRLDGSSESREFVLPFFNREDGPPPEQLVFNLVLSGAGTVEIGPIELVQFDAADDPFASSTGWWSDRQAGLMGGIVGSALGILGAAIGWLGSVGRGQELCVRRAQSNGISWRSSRHPGRPGPVGRTTLRRLLPAPATRDNFDGARSVAPSFDEQEVRGVGAETNAGPRRVPRAPTAHQPRSRTGS